MLRHYLVKFKCLTVQRFIHAVLAGLICTSNKWANYHPWQFSKFFHCQNHVMNGNWLICWMPAPLLDWCADTLFNALISV